ncbi:Wzz/FepE/Etk N-terminal domain-containing protein [Roseateles amylovorans]|uniref:Wzz/FepE/Etk N-terminal domain-containing protein n=1 Tax=Roseateles amylovorans TaxID=2978473 RepID=A0ABY6AWR3_9BURK|nr:Wzz/FepE/Etk N-terminal domain-containing protein [Roseateles amylovorans]UXH77621.1 Wzz/FepE/Etk N-terminal domain-containing protein [Roseateles amylovorans]
MTQTTFQGATSDAAAPAAEINLIDLSRELARHWRRLVLLPIVVGALALGATYLMAPQFTARTSLLPPQGGSSGALSAALNSSLGSLAGLAGAGGAKGSGDMYVSLLQSQTVADKLLDRFKLQELYKTNFRFESRDMLKSKSRISFNKKDGLIVIEVDDANPQRAAEIANQYVDELRTMTASMSLTEAQRKRAFFEKQLERTKLRLTEAQSALQAAGFSQGALRAEPKAAAEEYARTKAELTSTEVRLNSMRSVLADRSPELAPLIAAANALRAQLRSLEQKTDVAQGPDYVSKYREFKYQEALFEQIGRQFEAARLEESLEDNSIQVVDKASVPEWKSKPKRASIAMAVALIAFILLAIHVAGRHMWRSTPLR